MQTVAEIMDADPVTVGPDATIEEVYAKLREQDVNGLPVVNAGGRCVGIITEADLVIGDEEGDLHVPHYLELFGGLIPLEFNGQKHFEERLRKATAARAQELMTQEPVTISPEATAKEAAHVISAEHHNRLPVVEHGRLVGMVTRVDVLAALARDE